MSGFCRKLCFRFYAYDLDWMWLHRLHLTVCDLSPYEADHNDGSMGKAIDKYIVEDVEKLLPILHYGPATNVQLSYADEHVIVRSKAGENPNVDYVIGLVQAFLRYVKYGEFIFFEWSDETMLDYGSSYGGGAAVVAREKVWHSNTTRWMLDKIEELRSQINQPPP